MAAGKIKHYASERVLALRAMLMMRDWSDLDNQNWLQFRRSRKDFHLHQQSDRQMYSVTSQNDLEIKVTCTMWLRRFELGAVTFVADAMA